MGSETPETAATLSRRKLLQRLGLAAAVAYTAPVMLQLNEARASGGGSFSGSGGRTHYRRRYYRRRMRRHRGGSFS